MIESAKCLVPIRWHGMPGIRICGDPTQRWDMCRAHLALHQAKRRRLSTSSSSS